jgi:hypothetical protein
MRKLGVVLMLVALVGVACVPPGVANTKADEKDVTIQRGKCQARLRGRVRADLAGLTQLNRLFQRDVAIDRAEPVL